MINASRRRSTPLPLCRSRGRPAYSRCVTSGSFSLWSSVFAVDQNARSSSSVRKVGRVSRISRAGCLARCLARAAAVSFAPFAVFAVGDFRIVMWMFLSGAGAVAAVVAFLGGVHRAGADDSGEAPAHGEHGDEIVAVFGLAVRNVAPLG